MKTNLFRDIKTAIETAEELNVITHQTNDCFLDAVCSAIESDDRDLMQGVAKIIRNRVAGASLIAEDQGVVGYIESFRKPLNVIIKQLEN